MTQPLEQFWRQVRQELALADQFKAVSSPEEFANLAVQLGQELGYNFTIEEFNAALIQQSSSSSLELSDDQLKSVSGGGTDTLFRVQDSSFGWFKC